MLLAARNTYSRMHEIDNGTNGSKTVDCKKKQTQCILTFYRWCALKPGRNRPMHTNMMPAMVVFFVARTAEDDQPLIWKHFHRNVYTSIFQPVIRGEVRSMIGNRRNLHSSALWRGARTHGEKQMWRHHWKRSSLILLLSLFACMCCCCRHKELVWSLIYQWLCAHFLPFRLEPNVVAMADKWNEVRGETIGSLIKTNHWKVFLVWRCGWRANAFNRARGG